MIQIIMFKNIVETQEYFSYRIAEEMQNMGYKVYFTDNDYEDVTDELNEYINNAPDNTYAISFNYHGMIMRDNNGENLWESTGIPFINIVVDHPVYSAEFLKMVPSTYVHISIDEGHDKFMRKFYPQILNGPVMYLAGTRFLMEKEVPYHERKNEILFAGNYITPEKMNSFIAGMDKEYQDFYNEIAHFLINHPDEQFDETALKFIKEQALDFDEAPDEVLLMALNNMMYVDLYVRNYVRGLAVKELVDSGIKVHVMGKCWDRLDCKHKENIIYTPFADTVKCLEEMAHTKISLNVMPWFKYGPHDRVFSSMMNKCVCVTDTSKFIKDNYQDKNDVLFYSLKNINKLPDIVDYAMKNEEEMESIAQNGYKKTAASHTWAHRALLLSKVIEVISENR